MAPPRRLRRRAGLPLSNPLRALPAGGASAKRFGRRSALARGGPKTGAVGLSAQMRLGCVGFCMTGAVVSSSGSPRRRRKNGVASSMKYGKSCRYRQKEQNLVGYFMLEATPPSAPAPHNRSHPWRDGSGGLPPSNITRRTIERRFMISTTVNIEECLPYRGKVTTGERPPDPIRKLL